MSDVITLAHGNGGQLMQQLIREKIAPGFDLAPGLTDGAVLRAGGQEIVFSTDSFTVKPLFFPGGDIGSLAVNGTVNDLAAMAAQPLYLSCGAIIEQGFPVDLLEQILLSMRKAADSAGIKIVTGDTKVVEKGAADGIYLNTSGIGIRQHRVSGRFGKIRAGDRLVISGPVGDHGVAIALARDQLDIRSEVRSDCAALYELIEAALKEQLEITFMRDATRGGLATVLNELVSDADLGIEILASSIPVLSATHNVCEILGYDPLYLANEGRMVFVVASEHAERLVDILHDHPLGNKASLIGEVTAEHPGQVLLETEVGGHRVLDMLIYDQLPRIC